MSDDSKTGKERACEWKVMLVLVLALLGLEFGARGFESALSADARHLQSLPGLARKIAARDPRNQTTLVVGNSLARRGIDAGRLEAALGEKAGGDAPVHLEFFVPDASSINEWSWGLRRYFRGLEERVDRIIVVTGRRHLLDVPGNPEKTGAYFVGGQDLSAAMAEAGGEEEALRLGLGHFSRLAAIRDRVRPLVGYRFLPGFEKAWPEMVVAGYEVAMGRMGEDAGLWELDALRRFLDQAEYLNADVVIVAVPLPEPYQLPGDAVRLLEQRGVPLVDHSELPGIGPENFPDGYHLDPEGAAVFTERLIESLP